jgi:hypothetical protein
MHLLYQAPDDRTLLVGPTPGQIADILRGSGADYWQSGGNGEASIDVIRSPGEDVPTRRRMTKPDGTSVEFVEGEPSLWIKRPEDGRFFFTWDRAEGWWVPYDGGDCGSFVIDERGGDPFRIPRACLVDLRAAIEIASHFLSTLRRSPAVQWARWSDLPLPEGWYDA